MCSQMEHVYRIKQISWKLLKWWMMIEHPRVQNLASQRSLQLPKRSQFSRLLSLYFASTEENGKKKTEEEEELKWRPLWTLYHYLSLGLIPSFKWLTLIVFSLFIKELYLFKGCSLNLHNHLVLVTVSRKVYFNSQQISICISAHFPSYKDSV